MNHTNFKAKRIIRKYTHHINAPADEAFALMCPVRESDYLDGWNYEMVYSESGIAEKGSVFLTQNPGEKDTIWLITEHNKAKRIVQFARITPESRAAKLEIKVQPIDEGTSKADVTYEYTALSEEGNRWIEEYTEDKFIKEMKYWEDAMNHFLKTGEILPH